MRPLGLASPHHTSGNVTFVLATGYTPDPGGSQLVTFGGASAGQLAVLIDTRSTASTPSGWTLIDTYNWGRPEHVFSKILDAGDIASGVTFSYSAGNGTFMLLVYDGAASVAAVSTAQSTSASSQVISGFTKNGSSKVLITYGVCNDVSGTQLKPTGWTSRLAAFGSPYGGAGASSSACAELASASYTNGTSETWTGFPNPANLAASILEVI